jgi:hypothetical protein
MVFTDVGGFYTVFFSICVVLISSIRQTSYFAALLEGVFAVKVTTSHGGDERTVRI